MGANIHRIRRVGVYVPRVWEVIFSRLTRALYAWQRPMIVAGVLLASSFLAYTGSTRINLLVIALLAVVGTGVVLLRHAGNPLKVLYIGRFVESKGAHTIIEAMKSVRQSNPSIKIHLTLLGAGESDYVAALMRQISENGLGQWVNQHSWIPRDQVPKVMAGHDVLVLPTIHPEPLARAVQEAMAMGLNVVATSTGGTPEIVQDEITGLIFPPDNAIELARQLMRLHADSVICDRLAASAYEAVQREFTIQKTVDRIECLLRGF